MKGAGTNRPFFSGRNGTNHANQFNRLKRGKKVDTYQIDEIGRGGGKIHIFKLKEESTWETSFIAVLFLEGACDQRFWLYHALFVLTAVICITLLVFTGKLLFCQGNSSYKDKQKDKLDQSDESGNKK